MRRYCGGDFRCRRLQWGRREGRGAFLTAAVRGCGSCRAERATGVVVEEGVGAGQDSDDGTFVAVGGGAMVCLV